MTLLTMWTTTMDILVIGAGPAGLAASAELSARGLVVGCLAPKHPSVWPNNYGVWADDIAGLGLQGCAAQRWDQAVVYTGAGRRHVLDRGYLRLDNRALRARLIARCNDHQVRWLEGMAESVDIDAAGATVHTQQAHTQQAQTQQAQTQQAQTQQCQTQQCQTQQAQTHRATLVVDATGHRPHFVERIGPPPTAYQTAYGATFRPDGNLLDGDSLVLMDFRAHYVGGVVAGASGVVAGPAGVQDTGPAEPDELTDSTPTFLYAMELPDGRVFAEETVLAARPALGFGRLAQRLAARLHHKMDVGRLGLADDMMPADDRMSADRPDSDQAVERCVIPMDTSLPRLDQRVVGFGAAASMVHPATGYQMATMLRTAPPLARTVSEALGAANASPATAAKKAWQTIWPAPKRRAHRLWRFGLRCLLAFDAAETRAFFEAFFSLPAAQWGGYMSGTLGPQELVGVMWSVFRVAPMGLRATLIGLGIRELIGRNS